MLKPARRNARSTSLVPGDDSSGTACDAPEQQKEDLLAAAEAARRLGISRATLYDWLAASDYGLLKIRGNSATIEYLQGGPQGAGKIMIPAAEVERLRNLMRVLPKTFVARRPATPRPQNFPGITVPLGRPG